MWKQQCLDLDVVVKEGHLMLQQESSGQAVAFEEKLGDLNTEWHTVIQVWCESSWVFSQESQQFFQFVRGRFAIK